MRRSSSRQKAGPTQRQLRVAEEIRRTMVEILTRARFRDSDLQTATVMVSAARISPDLTNVTLFVAPLGGKREKEIIEALNRSRAYLRGELAHSIDLRHVPEIRFELDRSFAEADRIERLLLSEKVQRDIARKPSDDVSDGEESP